MIHFTWDRAPDDVFPAGFDAYVDRLMDALYAIMVEEAPRVQQFMRDNATWHDDHDTGREYLKAAPFRSDTAYKVGIVAYYDLMAYRQKNPKQDPKFDFGVAHETWTFSKMGVIAIILPRRPNTVLGEEAARVWDRVRKLMGP